MTTVKVNPPNDPISAPKVFKLIVPPKEFFRQFANLAHNRILNEDFPHEDLLTLKYKGTGADFLVNAKGSLSFKTEEVKIPVIPGLEKPSAVTQQKVEKKEVLTKSSEVEFLTAYGRTSTDARFNDKGVIRLWTNWGCYNIGKPIEFVSVLKGNTQFEKLKGSIAAYYSDNTFGSATRFQVRQKGLALGLAQKLSYSQKDFWGGLYADFSFTDLKLTHYDAVLGYNINRNFQIYGEHVTPKPKEFPPFSSATTDPTLAAATITEPADQLATSNPKALRATIPVDQAGLLEKLGVGKLSITGAYRDDRFHGLAQLGWDQPTEKFTFDTGVVYTANSRTIARAKINQDLEICLGGRHRFTKNISVNIGAYVPLQTSEKFYDPAKTIPIPFGVSVEFNF